MAQPMFTFKRKRKLTAEMDPVKSADREPIQVERVLLFAGLLLACALILSQGLMKSTVAPVEGQIAERDVFPPHGFRYVDMIIAEEEWEREYAALPQPFIFSTSEFDKSVEEFYSGLDASLAKMPGMNEVRRGRIYTSAGALIARIRRVGLLDRFYPSERRLSITRNGHTIEMSTNEVVQPGRWDVFLKERDPVEIDVIATQLDKNLRPTLIADDERAAVMKEKIRAGNPPRRIAYDPELPIIVAGQELSRRDVDLLNQLRDFRSQRNVVAIAALIAFLYITLLFSMLYMKRYLPRIYRRFRDVSAISFAFGAILLACLIVDIVFGNVTFRGMRLSNAALPVAATAMVLTMLYGARLAFIFSLFVSILCSVVLSPRISLLVMYVFGSMTGAITAAPARNRSDIMRCAGWIAGVQVFVIFTLGLILSKPFTAIYVDCASAIVSALISGFLVPIILIPVEAISRRVSNLRLLELADLNHPLLQLLLRKAPGTFQHSQHVALLAQSAAEAIGANSLLVRVGAYFHDIGKMRKPEYFTENQSGGDNPHDKLKPSLSASILRSHVLDGKVMAEEVALPQIVVDFVMEHHGTSVMSVFYHRALEAVGEDGTVDREDFRYPGPKPQSRETAILMLADAVEAATRSLVRPSMTKLERTLQRVIIERFEAEELNDCDLSLRDMNLIAEAFLHVLSAMHHTRNVQYPGADRVAEAEKRAKGEK